MKCPRCGAQMRLDSEFDFHDGKKPMKIYYCPKCGEMAHK